MTRKIELCRKRNIGIIAHVDAGKTTLTERLLYLAGAVHRIGEVHEGSTTTDSDAIERKKGITISAATVTCAWRDHEICIVDTPGHIDFSSEVELSLRVLDGAIVVLDGVVGVESQTESVWRQADRYELPRVCFVNKLDRLGADFERSVESLRERLGAIPAVVVLPIGEEHELSGVVDVVEQRALVWTSSDAESVEIRPVPAELVSPTASLRAHLVELCADFDDEVLAAYLAEQPVSAEALVRALRRGTMLGRLVPTLAGAAYRNKGIQPLLDAIVSYLPSPLDRPAVVPESGDPRPPSDDAPLVALVFKVVHDAFGALALVRVYSGVLARGTRVLGGGRSFRVGRLVRIFADRRDEVESARTGDVVGLLAQGLRVGDTLSDPEHVVSLGRPVLGRPVVRIALEPRTQHDGERLSTLLPKLVVADPSLEFGVDVETGRTLLCGQGELHLEVTLERLCEQHGIHVGSGRPSVAYREAIRDEVRREVRHSKQTGGPGQFARVVLVVGPAPDGAGLEFADETRGGAIPAQFVGGVRTGVLQAMGDGVLAGHPVADLRVHLVDAETHSKDSSELAFAIAARRCVGEALARARPYLLEPIMNLEVAVPAVLVGAVVGDLGARRGRVTEIGERAGSSVVRALVPLAETFGIAGALRAVSSGRASFLLHFSAYAPVPDAVARRILGEAVA